MLWLRGVWRGVDRIARTTGRAARGNHGSRAMVVVWLIGAVFVFALAGYGLTMRTPSWFHSGEMDGAESRRIAQRLENRIITEAYRFRGEPTAGPDGVRRTGEDWRLRVTEAEATAWLTARFPEWLANRDPPARVPPGVRDLQAHFGSGRAWIAGRVDESVYSFSTAVRSNGGGIWLSGVRAGVGSFWLPASWGGLGMLGMIGREESSGAWRIVSGDEPLVAGGLVRLEDGRRVRVLRAAIVSGAIEVDCRTEVP